MILIIVLSILGYWIGTSIVIGTGMYLALQFANFCAYVVDFFTRKTKIY